MLLRIPLYAGLAFGVFWLWAHLETKGFPEKPPMGDLTSRYAEKYSFATSWPFYYKYYLYKPENYIPTQKYPLVVLLHGVSRHMRGGQFILADAIRRKHPSFVLVPIAPELTAWGSSRVSELAKASTLAFDAIRETQEDFSIDADRIYVSGYSMGGTGTFAMVHDYPELFAAALPLCGAWDPAQAKFFPKDVPILAAHGSEDNPASSRDIVEELRREGAPARFLEYRGVGHNVWDYVYPDPRIWDWLFSQRRK